MTRTSLPTELVSLIHHVELSKAGWWDRGIDRLIQAMIWLQGSPQTSSSIVSALRTQLGISVDASAIDSHIQRLLRNGTLVPLGSAVKLSEQALRALDVDLKSAEEATSAAKRKFESLIGAPCPKPLPPNTWDLFQREAPDSFDPRDRGANLRTTVVHDGRFGR